MRYLFDNNISFTYLINLSGAHYPIKSTLLIKQALISSKGSLFIDAQPAPFRPAPEFWNQYVECDDILHRVTRLAPPRGFDMFYGKSCQPVIRF